MDASDLRIPDHLRWITTDSGKTFYLDYRSQHSKSFRARSPTPTDLCGSGVSVCTSEPNLHPTSDIESGF